jgi:hypothetical protein
MKVMISLFLTAMFTIPVLVSAQSASKAQKAEWDGVSRPDIKQTKQTVAQWQAEGKNESEISALLNALIPDGGDGMISGSLFSSNGETPLTVSSYIYVYDSHGYYAGLYYLDTGNTEYFIGNLPPDDYYVQASPNGLYPSVFYDGSANWQEATLVSVANDTVLNIDFHLPLGKVIAGKVLDQNSLDPLSGITANFMLYRENAQLEEDYELSWNSIITQDGSYSINNIRPGNYKLKIFVTEYAPEYYNDKMSLSTADIIQVAEESDTTGFVNFLMGPVTGVQDGYEPNQQYIQAWDFEIGDELNGQINPAGDADFFSFSGEQWDTLQISLKALSVGSPLFSNFKIYDSSGVQILRNSNSSDHLFTYILPYAGLYYLKVTSSNSQLGGPEFFYSLSVMYYEQTTPQYGAISGNVYLGNEETPYEGSGYYIQLYDSAGNYYNNYLFYEHQYQINSLPAGLYKINIDPIDVLWLSEWYQDVLSYQDATPVEVTGMDTTIGINIVLDAGGGISGRIFRDNFLSDHTDGGYLYLFNQVNGYNEYSFYIAPDENGLFTVSGIRPSSYTLRFDPSNANNYPEVWYENVGTQGQATALNIAANDTTDNITLILKRGGLIQGFVYMQDGGMVPVSADSLRIDIVPYDEQGYTGYFYGHNSFNGGYRTGLIYPGNYKLQALPYASTLSSWYYNTGSHFADPGLLTIEVKSDSAHEVPIILNHANGSISGIIFGVDGITPSNLPGQVLAYDNTGHLVQSVPIGFDPVTGQPLPNGHYRIGGLENGTYYLLYTTGMEQRNGKARVEDLVQQENIEQIKLIEIREGNYILIWYPNIIGDGLFSETPYFQMVPGGAVAVTVSAEGETSGINFNDLVNALEEDDKKGVPDKYELSAVYPNPFNPATTITYSVAQRSRVVIEIYDVLGRKVNTLLDEVKTGGRYSLKWDGKNISGQTLSSGIYFARMQAGGVISSRKMILLK